MRGHLRMRMPGIIDIVQAFHESQWSQAD